MTKRTCAAVLVAAAAALLAFVPAAAADQPVTTEVHLDRTRTFTGLCPFPFEAHTVGTLRETVFSNGKDVTHAIDFHITYSNPANGRTATTVLAGPVIQEPYGPGTVKVTIHGNDGHITVPGQGSVFANVGTLIYVADAVTGVPLQILKSTGQQDPSQFPATCDALA
jgi:hypothetical protein